MSTISVVLPSRNDAQMLAVCLTALARQTRRADEIIVPAGRVSARSFESWRSFGRRLGMAWARFRIEFGQEPPFGRRRQRWEREHAG